MERGFTVSSCFNPRAPCGARPTLVFVRVAVTAFQSTRPVRGATFIILMQVVPLGVSIHAPRAGRDLRRSCRVPRHPSFNPRAPCGARRTAPRPTHTEGRFQSTRPVRGATAKKVTTSLFCHIFMGLTRHEYGLLGAYVPHPSFDVVHAPIFLHFIFCLLHLRTPKST